MDQDPVALVLTARLFFTGGLAGEKQKQTLLLTHYLFFFFFLQDPR